MLDHTGLFPAASVASELHNKEIVPVLIIFNALSIIVITTALAGVHYIKVTMCFTQHL